MQMGKTMTAIQNFAIEQHGDVTELRLVNPALFDIPRYEELRDELNEFVDEHQPAKLLVDFSEVQYCSTAVIAALVQIKKRMGPESGLIRFCGMNEAVRDTFRWLRLDGTLFEIFETESAAMCDY